MNAILFAQETVSVWERIVNVAGSATIRIVVASILLAIAAYLLLPGKGKQHKWIGGVLGTLSVGLIWSLVPMTGKMTIQSAFWFMASLAVVASTATVTSRSPVYSAIWFAVSLLGVAGLFLLQGAQFLGIATVAVYAGAIVVTFLFVLMLAQPEGLSFYDRITWGSSPRFIIPIFAGALMALLANAITQSNAQQAALLESVSKHVHSIVGEESHTRVNRVNVRRFENGVGEIHINVSGEEDDVAKIEASEDDLKQTIALAVPKLARSVVKIDLSVSLQDPQHVAHLGGQLYGRYLIAIELAASLLMVALVGAIAIATHGSGFDLHVKVGPSGN
jgi:NADH-quinone oxidoreductase subunit J